MNKMNKLFFSNDSEVEMDEEEPDKSFEIQKSPILATENTRTANEIFEPQRSIYSESKNRNLAFKSDEFLMSLTPKLVSPSNTHTNGSQPNCQNKRYKIWELYFNIPRKISICQVDVNKR